jgi:WD40 repeat protein
MTTTSTCSPVSSDAPTDLARRALASTDDTPSSDAMAVQFQALRSSLNDLATAESPEAMRYVFGEVFARGGLGQIRRAFDRVLKRTIAVKEMLSAGDVERFTREAHVTAMLDHPAVIPVHDFGLHANGQPYYCMKLIDGKSLEAVIGGTKSLSERILLLPNVATVAEAVAFAHSKGILHRDLKPANILVGMFGETWVIDWGLTGYFEPSDVNLQKHDLTELDPERADLTRTGEWMGTLPYMAPEQRGGQSVDERADVYGLGAVLYHTLSGQRPYADTPVENLLEHITLYPPTDLEQLMPDVPPDLLAIVRRAMAPEPGSRYPDARTLTDDLRRFLAGRLVAAHTYRFSDVVRRWARRHRVALLVAAVALVIMGAAGIYGVRRVGDERDAAVRNEARAMEHQRAAESAREEAERRGAETRMALATTWEAEGRRELIDARRPIDAREPLARAAALAPERGPLRSMLAQAERPLQGLHCEGLVEHTDMLVMHPLLPLVALTSERLRGVELWNTDTCTQAEDVHLGQPITDIGFSGDGAELRILIQHRTLALSHLEIVRFSLNDRGVPSYTTLPISYGAGRFGDLADVAGFRLQDALDPASAVMYIHGSDAFRTIDVPAWRPRISPDGSQIAWLSHENITIRHDATQSFTRKSEDVRALLAVSDDGDTLVEVAEHLEIHGHNGSRVVLEGCGQGASKMRLSVGKFPSRTSILIAQDRLGDLRVWDTNSGRCTGAVTGHHVSKWKFVEVDGEPYLLTLDGDARLSVWRVDVDAGLDRIVTLNVHEDGVFDFDTRTASGALVTLGREGSMRVWDVAALTGLSPVLRGRIVAVHPSGTRVAVADSNSVRVVDPLGSDEVYGTWQVPTLDALRWDANGMLAARSGTQLFDWDPATAAVPATLDVGQVFDPSRLSHDAIESSALVVVSGTLKERRGDAAPLQDVRVYDRSVGRWHEFRNIDHEVRHPATSRVAKAGSRALLSNIGLLLDTDSASPVAALTSSAVFTPDGAGILDIPRRGGLTLYDAETGLPLQSIDETVGLPSRRRGQSGVLDMFPASGGVARQYRAVDFSPSGEMFAQGTGPNVTLWNHAALVQHTRLVGHRLPVSDVLWSGDGSRVLTRGGDDLACLWDAQSGKRLAEISNVGEDAKIAFSLVRVAVQDGPDRLTLVDLVTGARLFAVPVAALDSVYFDQSGQRLLVVEAPPGHDMSLRVVEVGEVGSPGDR